MKNPTYNSSIHCSRAASAVRTDPKPAGKSLSRLRRERQLRRRLTWAFLTVAVCLAASLLLGSFLSSAEDGRHPAKCKYYTSVRVMPGDTLWSLAGDYSEGYDSREEYILEVIQINRLPEQNIRAGEYLILPYFTMKVPSGGEE